MLRKRKNYIMLFLREAYIFMCLNGILRYLLARLIIKSNQKKLYKIFNFSKYLLKDYLKRIIHENFNYKSLSIHNY